MKYYSVMIVDDEEEVREAITRRMDWESLGFQVVETAENGEDALEKVEKLCPDVVLTDIQMPFMDGITFCKKLKERIYGTKIVIFSGYDEFEYAKEAIKLEAEEYILKPVDTLELQEVFRRIKKRLDEELDQKRNMERLEAYYQKSLPLLQQKFIISLLEGYVLKSEIDVFAGQYQLNLEAPYYVAGVLRTEAGAGDLGESGSEDTRKEGFGSEDTRNVDFESEDTIKKDFESEDTIKKDFESEDTSGEESRKKDIRKVVMENNLVLVSLQQIVEENLEKEFRIRSVNNLDKIGVIAMLDNKAQLTAFVQAMDKICKMSSKILGVNISAGIGNACTELIDLSHSLEEAETALDYRILVGPNQAVFIQDIEPKSEERFAINEKEIMAVIRDIKFGTPEDIEQTIRGQIVKLEQANISMVALQTYFMEMAVEITRLSRVYELDAEQLDGMELYFQGSVKDFESLQAMGERFISICLNLRGQIRRERTDATKLLIDKAKQYIEEKYGDPEISVEKLCNFLNLSPTYFSTLFKKETNMSFVNYLTQVRLESAIRLLNTTEEKAYIISEMVGYMDPNYFSYVFKKKYGISPSKYRVNQAEKG